MPSTPRPGLCSSRFGWKHRLHRASEFKAVFADKTHRPIRTAVFTVYRRDNDCAHPRLGITVSRRAARKAVHRSRIKRGIRETFRQQQHTLPNMDFVITCAERVTAKASFKEMTELLREAWHKATHEAAHKGAAPAQDTPQDTSGRHG